MTDVSDDPAAEMATVNHEDQPAETAAPAVAAEPVDNATAEAAALNEPGHTSEHGKDHTKPAVGKAKSTPAKSVATEAQPAADRPSGRRERKQTSFFQPEKVTETEKLEIKDVST